MKKFIYCLLAASCLLFCNLPYALASHMVGGSIECQVKSNDSLKITLRVYRDCNGIPINASPSITIKTMSSSVVASRSITLRRKSISPISVLCPGQNSTCTGGSFPFGIEEHMFDTTLRVDSAFFQTSLNNVCWLRLSFQECCRNGSITNINAGNFYVDTEINRCVINTSPRFKNYPISVVCTGQEFWYNNAAMDSTENDSLVTELASPLMGENTPETYLSGFDSLKPLTFLGFPNTALSFPSGFNLNKATGDLGFTLLGVQQPVLAFKFTEWRKINGTWTKISVVRRDAQFFGYNCPPNNVPEIEVNGSNNVSSSFSICASTPFCLTLRARDKDSTSAKSDTTSLSVMQFSQAYSFTTANGIIKTKREDSAVFCWTPGAQQASSLPYYLTIRAFDSNCPVRGSSVRNITFLVRAGTANGAIQKTSNSLFNYSFNFNRTDTGSTGSYRWTISGNKNGLFDTTGGSTYTTKNFTHTFSQYGTYVVRAIVTTNSCDLVRWDTVKICQMNPGSVTTSADVMGCNTRTSQVSCTTQFPASVLRYRWLKAEIGKNTVTLNDSTASITVSDTNNLSGYTKRYVYYIASVTDTIGCTATDTTMVTLHKGVKFLPQTSQAYTCAGNGTILEFAPVNNDSLIRYKWSNNKTGPAITETDSGIYKISAWNPDSSCITTDSIKLNVKAKPDANLGADQFNCAGKAITLAGVSGATNTWFANTTQLSGPNVSPTATTTYRLRSVFVYPSIITCTDWDTLLIRVGQKAAITMPSLDLNQCSAGAPITLVGQTPVSGGTGTWSSSKPTCLSGNVFNLVCAGVGSHKVYYTFDTDTFHCISRDSLTLSLGVPTSVTITPPPAKHCISNGNIVFNATPASGVWSAGANCFSGNTLNVACAGAGNIWCKYTLINNFNCVTRDSAMVKLIATPVTNFSASPRNGAAPLTVNFTDLSTGSPNIHEWDLGDPLGSSTSTLLNPSYTYQYPGVYFVRLTTRVADLPVTCSDSLLRLGYIQVNNGTNGITSPAAGGMAIYPNPATGSFTVELPAEGNYQCTLFDVSGKLQRTETINAQKAFYLNKGKLAAGVYLICVKNLLTGAESRQKLVLE